MPQPAAKECGKWSIYLGQPHVQLRITGSVNTEESKTDFGGQLAVASVTSILKGKTATNFFSPHAPSPDTHKTNL